VKGKKIDKIPDLLTKEDIRQEIGNRIRAVRKKQTSSYVDFAKGNGIPNMVVWKVEAGKPTSFDSIITVARAAGIEIEDLFKGIK